MIGGTALAVYGLLRPSLSGLALAAIGGALIWRGHTGHCDVYQKLGYSSAENATGEGAQPERPAAREQRAQLDESHASR